MKTAKLFLVAGLVAISYSVRADYSATLFEQGSNKAKKLYTFELKSVSNGAQDVTTATYKDLEGKTVYEDKSTLEGSRLIKSEIVQHQTGQSATVEVQGDKVVFLKTADGKTKTSEEKLGKSFVMSGNFQRFVKDNWSDLAAGKTVDFRYGVWDRQETVGFSVFKTGNEDLSGQKAVVLKMKPSSFIIAALVKPIFFKFTEDGTRLLEMNGRVPAKQKSGDSFKDLDAEVVYAY